MKTTILTIILIILACCSFKLGVSSEKKKCDIVIQVNGTIFTIPHG